MIKCTILHVPQNNQSHTHTIQNSIHERPIVTANSQNPRHKTKTFQSDHINTLQGTKPTPPQRMSDRNQSLHPRARAKASRRRFAGETPPTLCSTMSSSAPPPPQPRSSLGVDPGVLDPRVYLPRKEVSRSCCVSAVHGLVVTSQEGLLVCSDRVPLLQTAPGLKRAQRKAAKPTAKHRAKNLTPAPAKRWRLRLRSDTH